MIDLRVTIVIPHQRVTSGGPTDMQLFARHLVPHAQVCLAVMKGAPMPVEGVDVRAAPTLMADELPNADVLVAYAGVPHLRYLQSNAARTGRVLLWYGGFDAYHPRVADNMRRAPRVLALSSWLVREARRYGCQATYVQRPLDRSLWRPGPGQLDRRPIVAMMARPQEPKGMADGLRALEHVHREYPDAEIHLFGSGVGTEIRFPAVVHPPSDVTEIVALMQSAAVVVSPSWEEGFGLPALEGMACGAAIATTEAGGNRGYAFHRRTALVSPARAPDLLAENVLELLRNPSLRDVLVQAGLQLVEHSYVSWPDAGARLAATLATEAGRPLPHCPPPTDEVASHRYTELLKGALTGAVHQEVHAIVRKPEKLLPPEMLARLDEQGIVLARRQSGERRETQVRDGREWPLTADTMIGLARLRNLEQCMEDVVGRGVSGDFIEAGVWRGGAAIFMRGFLAACGIGDRRVWVADSFEGLPPPDRDRYPQDDGDLHHTYAPLAVDLDTVKMNFRRYGLLDDQVVFLKGWFSETLPRLRDRQWAVIRIDGDMYESTMEALEALYPRLSIGGYAIIDDYGALPGAAAAVDDYRREHGIEFPIKRVDWTGAFWRKDRALE